MKLLYRLIALLFVLLTLSTSAIGYFALGRYHSSQIARIDQSLKSKVDALHDSTQDPLANIQYLAEVSAIPLTALYITESSGSSLLTSLGPTIRNRPTQAEIKKALQRPVTISHDIRIRSYELSYNEYVVVAESTADIESNVHALRWNLIWFIAIVDLIALIVAFLIFRKDSKVNQLSNELLHQRMSMQTFLGDASHELRTPLTVIKGYVELALKTPDPIAARSFIAKSESEIVRMEKLIGDILLLAELGEVATTPTRTVDLGSLIKRYADSLVATQPERKITTEIASQATLRGDQELLEQMVANIFSNIRAHTPADAPVHIALSASPKEISLMIEDGGPGLVAFEEQARLFQRFDKSRSRASGGSGLGMSIIQGVIQRSDGKLQLSRSFLGGLRLAITIPRE